MIHFKELNSKGETFKLRYYRHRETALQQALHFNKIHKNDILLALKSESFILPNQLDFNNIGTIQFTVLETGIDESEPIQLKNETVLTKNVVVKFLNKQNIRGSKQAFILKQCERQSKDYLEQDILDILNSQVCMRLLHEKFYGENL